MVIKRLWKRGSQYYPAFHGKSFSEDEHIRETVYINLTEDGLSPLVTRHSDGTVAIHDTVKWGSIQMTRVQAVLLADRLNETLYRKRLK